MALPPGSIEKSKLCMRSLPRWHGHVVRPRDHLFGVEGEGVLALDSWKTSDTSYLLVSGPPLIVSRFSWLREDHLMVRGFPIILYYGSHVG